MKTIYTLYKQYYKNLTLHIIFLLALSVLNMLVLIFGKGYFSRILSNVPFEALLSMSISVIVYTVLQTIYELFLNNSMTYRALPIMIKDAFHQSLLNSNRHIEEVGFYVMSCTQEINLLIPYCFRFVASCLNIIILTVFLFSVSAFLPIILLTLAILTNIPVTYLDKQINMTFQLLDNKGMSYSGKIARTFQSIFLVLNNSIKTECEKSISKTNEELLKIENKIKILQNIKNIILEGQTYFIPVIVSLYSIFMLPGTTLGNLLYTIFIISLITQNVSGIFLASRQIKRAIPVAEKYFTYIQECKRNENKNYHDGPAIINVKDVSLAKNEKHIFNNISFEINDGEQIAVVGQNGSGKTSLLRILTMNDVNFSGTVTYNAKMLSDKTIPCLWSQPHVFNISLRDNLTFGKLVLDTDIMDMVNVLKLNHFVDTLPNGLDTIMDMNNLTVSDGERSRIALARILLLTPDSPILLLDEFSRNVNTEIEDLMLGLIFSNKSTIFAVTNNIKTAMRFQKILFVSRHDGSLAEIPKDVIVRKIKNRKK